MYIVQPVHDETFYTGLTARIELKFAQKIHDEFKIFENIEIPLRNFIGKLVYFVLVALFQLSSCSKWCQIDNPVKTTLNLRKMVYNYPHIKLNLYWILLKYFWIDKWIFRRNERIEI